jgi:anti-sigma regulatory factor (Ser/Thr protein kinase)
MSEKGVAPSGGLGEVPDVAIVDLEMKGSVDVAELARSVWPNCAVVFRSGREPAEISLAGRLSGAVGFLHEDLDAQHLSRELDHLLSLVGVAESAMAGTRADEPEAGTSAPSPSASSNGVKHTLAAHPRSAGEARRAVQASLSSWAVDDFSDDAALLVTELVTNAVRHVGSEVEVSVVLRPDALRVEVSDFSPVGAVEAISASSDAEGGRGLAIVEGLASRWGVITHSAGKTVWFELDRSHGRSPG